MRDALELYLLTPGYTHGATGCQSNNSELHNNPTMLYFWCPIECGVHLYTFGYESVQVCLYMCVRLPKVCFYSFHSGDALLSAVRFHLC